MGDWLGAVDPTVSGRVEAHGGGGETVYEWADPDLAAHRLDYTRMASWSLATGLDETNWPWRPRE